MLPGSANLRSAVMAVPLCDRHHGQASLARPGTPPQATSTSMARDPAGLRDRHDAATYRLEPVHLHIVPAGNRAAPARGRVRRARNGTNGHLPSLGRNPARERSLEPTITAAPVVNPPVGKPVSTSGEG